jgi:hypothetical protein
MLRGNKDISNLFSMFRLTYSDFILVLSLFVTGLLTYKDVFYLFFLFARMYVHSVAFRLEGINLQ